MANEYRPLDERNKTIVIDFETRSAAVLGNTPDNVGADKYSEHRTTDVLCMAYTLGQSKQVKILTPRYGSVLTKHDEQPVWVQQRYWEQGYVVEAWNVGFERAIWRNVCAAKLGWPDIPDECWRDTMVQAAVCALPQSLGGCGAALTLPVQKDEEGKSVMMKLSRPRSKKGEQPVVFWEKPTAADYSRLRENGRPITKAQRTALEKIEADFTKLYAYCIDDVRAEREIMYALPPLTDTEVRHMQHTFLMNKRGIYVDERQLDVAVKMMEEYMEYQNENIRRFTNGQVESASNVQAIKDWMATYGVVTDSIDKQHVEELLNNPRVPDNVKSVLTVRKNAGKASTSKLTKMKATLCSWDDRIHGAFRHHGATTGRLTAKGGGLQTQNFPRGSLEESHIEEIFRLIDAGANWRELEKFGEPMDVLSSSLRGFLRAKKGHRFLSADFSNIEGRVVAWLSDEESKLEKFREFDVLLYDENGNVRRDAKGEKMHRGTDIYKLTAASILGIDPKDADKHLRQAYGKVPELALGFLGGAGAFKMMAKTYDVHLGDDEVDKIVKGWRAAHPNIVSYGYENHKTVMRVIRTGKPEWSGKVHHYLEDIFLCTRLPSGRILRYAYPRIEMVTTPWGDEKLGVTFMTMKKPQNAKKEVFVESDEEIGDEKWIRIQASPGLFTENYTQAVARDIMVEAAYRLDYEKGYPMVMSVHDELVAEVPEGYGSLDEFERLMAIPPSWGPDIPIACEGWEGYFYRK